MLILPKEVVQDMSQVSLKTHDDRIHSVLNVTQLAEVMRFCNTSPVVNSSPMAFRGDFSVSAISMKFPVAETKQR